MDARYYPLILKRKSFHLFRGTGAGTIAPEELEEIREAFASFEPLYPDIRVAIRIVPSSAVSFKRDAEYCILLYSEKKDNYLMNAGYLGEQLDLYLFSRGIGALWFGLGKPDEAQADGLDYVIMIAVRKVDPAVLFRRNIDKTKRKPLSETWTGDTLGIAEVARYAPSACNSQPWSVRNENGMLRVDRYKKNGMIGIMTEKAALYFNRIDIGIYLCILEICLAEKKIGFTRSLYIDTGDETYTPVAQYTLGDGNEQ